MIDVVIPTWPNHPARIAYFEQTVAALRGGLTAVWPLDFLCSAETEGVPAAQGFEVLCRNCSVALHWRRRPASYAGNLNAALSLGSGEYKFLVFDDMELTAPLDLTAGIDLMHASPRVIMIRYGWPQDERTVVFAHQDGWWRAHNRYGWICSGHPFLVRRDFVVQHTGFNHLISAEETDSDFIRRLRKITRGRLQIAVSSRSYFKHIGAIAARPDAGIRSERRRDGAN